MTTELNWAGTHRYRGTIVEPDTLAETQRLVARADRVRPLGTRHSFNDLPDGDGVLLHLGRLPADPVLDPATGTITVGGATRYGAVAEFLQRQGLALHNLGSLPHISVAGAIATGTHGSGDANPNLSAVVTALELISPSGDLLRYDRGDPRFDGMVVSLGALGPAARVSLEVQPSFQIRQDAWLGLPWEVLLSDFDQVSGSGYSVSVMTHWGAPAVEQVWVKTRLDQGSPADLSELGARPAPSDHFAGSSNMTEFGTPGPWSVRLPHFRLDSTPSLGEEIQVEWMVPRPSIASVIAQLRELAEHIDPLLVISELRTMAADTLWLSPAFGEPQVGVHFTLRRDPVGVAQLLPLIEPVLLKAGGRPHWGKVFAAGAAELTGRYPRRGDWLALRADLDPDTKFGAPYLTRVLGVPAGN